MFTKLKVNLHGKLTKSIVCNALVNFDYMLLHLLNLWKSFEPLKKLHVCVCGFPQDKCKMLLG